MGDPLDDDNFPAKDSGRQEYAGLASITAYRAACRRIFVHPSVVTEAEFAKAELGLRNWGVSPQQCVAIGAPMHFQDLCRSCALHLSFMFSTTNNNCCASHPLTAAGISVNDTITSINLSGNGALSISIYIVKYFI